MFGRELIESICLTCFLLVIWFQTDFVVEYGGIISKISSLLKIEEFEKYRETAPLLTYPVFLSIYYSNFIIKGLTCPICLNTWISIMFYFMFGVSFSVNFCGSIVLYYSVCKLKR